VIAGSLARRYARALFALAEGRSEHEKVGKDLRALADIMKESAELARTLANPAIPGSSRRKVMEGLMQRLGVTPTTTNFVKLLVDRDRLSALPDIARELDRMIDDKAGRIAAEVVSATALSPAQVGELTKRLEKLSGKKVQLTTRQDPELLGGVVAKVGDVIYDGSLRRQLERLREQVG
jgi:F-type H+-transporting ATPase subunit delta